MPGRIFGYTSSMSELLVGDLYRFQELLSPAEAAVVERVRAFLAAEVTPIANEHWARADFPHHLIKGFADLGIAGQSASNLLSGWLALEMGHADASLATFFGVHAGLAMGSIAACGSPEQRERWLPAMSTFAKIGAFALTEPTGGSDVAAGLRTTARRDGDHWVLNGQKRWIGNATFADLIVVWARDVADDQVKGFVVGRDTPGYTATRIEGKIALRIVQNADITLTDCVVPEADRLQRAHSFKDTADILRQTRSGVAWQAVGVMLAAYEIALAYAKEREQFGRPIGWFRICWYACWAT
jgi:glutaryl-CoA dehydrogenase